MPTFRNRNPRTGRAIWLSIMLPFLISSTEFNRDAAVRDKVAGISSHPGAPAAEPALHGEFSVITYNIAGLPQVISSAVTDRTSSTTEIGRILNRFDVAHVQEDFNYNRFLYRTSAHYHRTVSKGKVLFGDGLNTLSKFPIREIKRIRWNDCTGADCLTPKGFTYSRMEVARHVFIDFYNVHANAYNHPSAAAARRKNIAQLSRYIQDHSAGNAVVVMGDLNGHYCFGSDNIGLLSSANGLADSWVVLKNKGILPASSASLPASNILALTDSCETIDKIMYRSSETLKLSSADYRLESRMFTNRAGKPLSDHHPVSARIVWKLEDMYLTQSNAVK